MPIRSIDMQVLIPKSTELQKIKSVETETPKNNTDINLHKDQQQLQQSMQQVKQTPKSTGGKIERDQKNKEERERKEGKKKNNPNKEQEEQKKNELDSKQPKTKIDIRL